MKRIISFFLCILTLFSMCAFSCADVDLSGMSFDELVALKDKINLAIWNSAEWQEVEVPQGVWEVGVDIPVGKWTIKATTGNKTMVSVGQELRDGGTDVRVKAYEVCVDPANKRYEANSDVTEWTIDLVAGDYVHVELGTAVFSPYSGKQSLGFK